MRCRCDLWDRPDNPPYSYYIYHMWANLNVLNKVYPTPHNLRPTPDTLRPTPDTLRPTPDTLRPTPVTLRPNPYTLPPTRYTRPPTPCTVRPTAYSLNPSPYAFPVPPTPFPLLATARQRGVQTQQGPTRACGSPLALAEHERVLGLAAPSAAARARCQRCIRIYPPYSLD